MNLNSASFNRSILYKGINITSKSSCGYRYRIKKSYDDSLETLEFMNEFIRQLNANVRKQASQLQKIDILAILFEFPLVLTLLVFSSRAKNNQTLLISISVIVIITSIIFIYLKITGIITLNQQVQEFLDQKKEVLSQMGLRAFVIKANCNDRAPDIFINLLPENLTSDLGFPVQNQERIKPILTKDHYSDSEKVPLSGKQLRYQYSDDHNLEIELEAENKTKNQFSNRSRQKSGQPLPFIREAKADLEKGPSESKLGNMI